MILREERCVRFSVGWFLQQCGVAEIVGLHDGGYSEEKSSVAMGTS